MQRLRDALYTNGWLRHIVLMLLGASLTFAYSPFTLSFLPLVVLPCVVLIINPLNPKYAFRAGFFFGYRRKMLHLGEDFRRNAGLV